MGLHSQSEATNEGKNKRCKTKQSRETIDVEMDDEAIEDNSDDKRWATTLRCNSGRRIRIFYIYTHPGDS